MQFNGLTLIVLIAMVFLCLFVFWTYLNTVYGIITPYNTDNPSVVTDYCGYKEYNNCKSITQNIPIKVSSIQNLDEVFNNK